MNILFDPRKNPRGSTVRDNKGKAYIVWHDGSLRYWKNVVTPAMRRMTPQGQTNFGLAVAKVAGEALTAQDAAQEGGE